jgi:hypothetical protein
MEGKPVSKLKPFMTYMTEEDHASLRKFARSKKLTMAQLIREGVTMRMSDGTYTSGFNDGIKASIKAISGIPAAQMRFPSGQSFSELIADELFKQMILGQSK